MSGRLMFMDVFNSDTPTEDIKNTSGRILFDLNRVDLSYYDRKTEVAKLASYKTQILVNLCLLTLKKSSETEEVMKKLANDYLYRTLKVCKEYKTSPISLIQPITDQDSREVYNILHAEYNWTISRIQAPELNILYVQYCVLLNKLLYLVTRKNKQLFPAYCYKELELLIDDYKKLTK